MVTLFSSKSNAASSTCGYVVAFTLRRVSKRELKSYSKPWLTTEIKTSIRVKNALYRKYFKNKSEYVHCKFNFYRNKLNLLKCSMRLYYNNYFLVNINNSNKV